MRSFRFGKFYYVLLLAVFIITSQSYAQSQDDLKKMYEKLGSQNAGSVGTINADAPQIFGNFATTYSTSNVALEEAINSNDYIVGPNDMFSLGIYGYINQQVPLVVSLEGTIIIPTVGEINVNGISLADAKRKVTNAVKKRYYSSDVSLTLIKPKVFTIKITGLNQGSFQVSSITRVSQLLNNLILDTLNISKNNNRKYTDNKNKIPEEVFPSQMSLRNIELVRKNGNIEKVDIYKFFMTNDDRYNPFFREGDFLKIPYNQLDKNFITINGGVQLGGSYEYSSDDDLETAIGLARGFDVNAEKDSIIIYRPQADSKGFEVINLSYDRDKYFKIRNYDRIFVSFNSDYKRKSTVLVLGEVPRPGYYPVSFKNTHLSDVIEMAGGVLPTAYLPLSILFRKYDSEYTNRDSAEILINLRANDLITTEADRSNFVSDIGAKRNRVIVDFESLLQKGDKSQDPILEDKDVIYINDNKNIVYVYGQVNNEGYVPYESGKDYEYYIQKAGGYSLAAEEGDTRVIKFNSRGWFKPDETTVQSGDYIYVPKKVNTSFSQLVTIISAIGGLILALVTTIIVINK
ncbi:N/A [soil metagenome]